jgi:hypothetical protein
MRIACVFVGVGSALAIALAQSSQAPFSLTIAAVQTEVKTGAEVTVSLTLTNTSNRDVTLEFTSPLNDYVAEVRDSNGKLAPDTEFKRKSSDPHGIHLKTSGLDMFIHLKPNDFWKDSIPVSLLKDMSKPGEYFVRVTWKAPKEFGDVMVKSNTIKVIVTP